MDDIRFLSDSRHRAIALDALAEAPQSRAGLREATGASSATIGRLLQAFDERGFVVKTGSVYSLTPLGEFIADAFARLQHDVALARKLEVLLPHVPLRDIGITVDQLTDAEVTQRTQANPFAVVSRVRELELNSADARSLTDFFPEPCIDGRYEAIVNGTQTFEAVFSPVVIESAVASDSADKFTAIVAADRTDIYVYDVDIDQPVMVHDGIGCLLVRDEDNVSIGMIETADDTVVDWVTNLFETYRGAAMPLTAEDLQSPIDDVIAEA